MRFSYQYKTSDGERHAGEMRAASRELVFSELKKRGIKPYGVVLSPGLWNHIQAMGKRSLAIVVLAIAVIGLGLYGLSLKRVVNTSQDEHSPFESRSQIYGDPSILSQCQAKGWANVFTNRLDLLLAAFAIPGRGVDLVRVRECAAEIREPLDMELVDVVASDPNEIARMKRMVNWMKRELKTYLADGGSLASYVRRLQMRQQQECDVRGRVELELKRLDGSSADYERQWEQKNDELRTMGLLPIPMP